MRVCKCATWLVGVRHWQCDITPHVSRLVVAADGGDGCLQVLGLQLPLKRRDPHYFLPTTGSTVVKFVLVCCHKQHRSSRNWSITC